MQRRVTVADTLRRMNIARLVALLTMALSVGCGGAPPPAPAVPTSTSDLESPVAIGALEYKEGNASLEGYLAMPIEQAGKKLPAIVLVHDWMGISDDTKARAVQFARLGYVVLAADIYGKGVHPSSAAEAGKLAARFKSDRTLLRARMSAAIAALVANPRVDAAKLVALGYCFGGTAALEAGRGGADLRGIISFHGGLQTPTPGDAKNIKGRVLALHGGDDPFVNSDEVKAFEEEMRAAKVDWQLVSYGGAVHAFTVKAAGGDAAKGAAYNAFADARSWEESKRFLTELWTR